MSLKKNKKREKEHTGVAIDPTHHFVQKKIGADEEIEKTKNDTVERMEIKPIHTMPRKKKNSKETKEKIEIDLTAIYTDSEGNIPNMRTFAKRKKHSLAGACVALALSLVFFGVVLRFGFSLSASSDRFVEEGVVLSISGDTRIMMGETVTYRVRYKNAQNIALNRATIELRYPEGFEFVTSSIASVDEQHNRWDLGSVAEDESGYIDISGHMYAPLNSEHLFEVFLNYQPANFSSTFQRIADTTSVIIDAPVSILITGPSEARAGKEVAYTISVQTDTKKGSLPDDLRLMVKPNSGFAVVNSKPAEILNSGWSVINAQSEQTFAMVGSFGQNESGQASSTLRLVLIGVQNQKEFTLFEVSHDVVLLASDIRLSLVVNGKNESVEVAPGGRINPTITLENTSEVSLTDLEIQLSIDAPAYEQKSILAWSRIDDVFEGDTVGSRISDTARRGIVSWNKKHIPDLALLKPGATVVIDLRIPLQNGDETDLSVYEAFKGEIVAEVKYKKKDAVEIMSGQPLEFIIVSDAKLETRSERTDDVYDISWILTNSFHDLENVKIEADLFGDISFDANAVSAPAGSISYDDVLKRLIWSIQDMPTTVDILALQFEVKLNNINPSQKNITSRVKGKAIDLVTGKELDLVGDEVLVR